MGVKYIELLPPSLIYIIYFIVEVSVRLELTSLGYKARILNLYTKRPSLTVTKVSNLFKTTKLFSNFFITFLVPTERLELSHQRY